MERFPELETANSELSVGTRKRLSRIKRRAIPAVREAYEKGLISAHKADNLLYLPKHQQAKELAGILTDRESRERTAHPAAETEVVHQIVDLLRSLEGTQL